MAKRKRRAFTKEFKAQAVRIVRESGKAIGAVARELDLTETALRSWVRQAEIDAGRGAPGALTTEEREELGRLRRENRTLRMERDILKKATAFFAKEHPGGSRSSSRRRPRSRSGGCAARCRSRARGSTHGTRARRRRGRKRTPGWASRSRRSMLRTGSATAARGFTPSWRTAAVARVGSAWRV